jgi:hypothetical protein
MQTTVILDLIVIGICSLGIGLGIALIVIIWRNNRRFRKEIESAKYRALMREPYEKRLKREYERRGLKWEEPKGG